MIESLREREDGSHLGVLPGGDSDVGVRAEGGRCVQVICADVIKCVAEAAAHRTAVIPAKEKTRNSNELVTEQTT